MKANDIRNYTSKEIETIIKENTALIAELRFSNRVSPIENPARIKTLKRDNARMLTILNERSKEETQTADAQ